MEKTLTLGEVVEYLQGTLMGGDPKTPITGVSGIREARSGDITFLGHPRYRRDLEATRAAAVVVAEPLDPERVPCPQVQVKHPYYAFARLMGLFHRLPLPPPGISSQAHIGRAALGEGISIGPFVTVGDGAEIGRRTVLYPGVYVGEGVRIGEESILYANVTLREGVRIGCRVIIHSGTVVGSDGYGFVFHEGRHHKILQMGGVVIEDDVEIGANVSIDRGTIGDTWVKRGTKIDNLVQIGHNVTVGEHSLLVAQVGISGSTEIGDFVAMGGQAGAAGHIHIGDRVQVGAKSGVTRDVSEGETISGFPAVSHTEWLKTQAVLRNLPRLRKRMMDMEERIRLLEDKIMQSEKERSHE
jgi:UDP-3-O-[3-hydroxymyristoyl] glucosamine N-acyltransferase